MVGLVIVGALFNFSAVKEIHCTSDVGHNLELLVRKTPYHIVSVNHDIKRITHIQDMNNLNSDSDYMIEEISGVKKTHKLRCKIIDK